MADHGPCDIEQLAHCSPTLPAGNANPCARCGLACAIPVIPLYAPYTVRDLAPGRRYMWCACGRSARQPFCDGTLHSGSGIGPVSFEIKRSQSMFSLCGCKYTRSPPYCDGFHTRLGGEPTSPPCTCPLRVVSTNMTLHQIDSFCRSQCEVCDRFNYPIALSMSRNFAFFISSTTCKDAWAWAPTTQQLPLEYSAQFQCNIPHCRMSRLRSFERQD